MDKLVINAASRHLLSRYERYPGHALLLTGEEGVGLGSIAKALAEQLTEPAYITTVTPENGTIPIATVRELYAHTKTKQDVTQVIIMDDADTMKPEAQNALLKLLEEPTSHVSFILTSHSPQLLLQTIHSRVQTVPIRPVSKKESAELLQKTGVIEDQKSRQILFIAEGMPAEIIRLSSDDTYFQTHSAKAIDARSFMQSSTYDRLILIAKYTAREDAIEFLDILGKFAVHTMYRQPDMSASKRLDAINTAIERIHGNGHVKTHLSQLVMQWG